MGYSKVLVAYDGSESSKKALDKAVELGKWNEQIEIQVLHVVNFPDFTTAYEGINIVELREASVERGNSVIQETGEVLSGGPNKFQTFVVEGYPAQMILNHANKNNCDLIVMGSRGLSGLKELFLGSVSHHVVQRSPVPVLIVK